MFPTYDTSPIALQHMLNARLSAHTAFVDKAHAKPVGGCIQAILRLFQDALRSWQHFDLRAERP